MQQIRQKKKKKHATDTLQDFHHFSLASLTLWIHFQNTSLQRQQSKKIKQKDKNQK